MEPTVLCIAEQAMEDMAHFMEKRDYIVVPHECRFIRRWFGEIGDHCG